MRRFLVVEASTKRSPAIASGKRGTPVVHLPSFLCTPLDPADGDTSRDLAFRVHGATGQPFRVLQTFVASDLDIIEGDVLVVGTREYPIRGVHVWPWRRGQTYLKLLLEEVDVGQSRFAPSYLLDFSAPESSQYVGLI